MNPIAIELILCAPIKIELAFLQICGANIDFTYSPPISASTHIWSMCPGTITITIPIVKSLALFSRGSGTSEPVWIAVYYKYAKTLYSLIISIEI